MNGRGRGKPLNYKEKSGISYINQEDPPFIQKMKKQLGYKEPAKLDDKVNNSFKKIENSRGFFVYFYSRERKATARTVFSFLQFTDEPGPNDVDDDGSTEAELLRMKEEDRPQVGSEKLRKLLNQKIKFQIVVLNPETDIGHDEIQKKLDEKQKEEDG